MVSVYFLSRCIYKKYFYNIKFNKKVLTCLLLVITLLEGVVTHFLFQVSENVKMFQGTNVPYYYDMYYAPTLMISIFIFLIFKDLKIYNKFINVIAVTTFDVYLISDYPSIRKFLWMRIFNFENLQSYWYFIPTIILSISIVFITCSFIGFLKFKYFDKILFFIKR